MTIKLKIILLISFIVIYAMIYALTTVNKGFHVEQALKKSIETLKTNLELTSKYLRENTSSAYSALKHNEKVIEIFSKAQGASPEEKVVLREALQKTLEQHYKRMKNKGVEEFNFVFANSINFLRFSMPKHFDDNLSGLRYSYDYVNRTQKQMYGFETGKFTHGYRCVYPFFTQDHKYLGLIEIAFSSKEIQDDLTNINKIHSHILIKKELLQKIEKNKKGFIDKYRPSIELKDYMFETNFFQQHERLDKSEKSMIQPLREEIDKHIALKEPFALYIEVDDVLRVISFLPIRNIKNEIEAYIVSYTDSNVIQLVLKSNTKINIILFITLLVLFVFIYILLIKKQYLEEKVTEKTKELVDLNNNLESQVCERVKEIGILNEEIHATQKEVVFMMGTIGETRSKETGNHVKRVARYSKIFALKYGLSEEEASLLSEASPMHDIGKVGIPDSILNKPSKLTEKEFLLMKEHARIGYEMLRHSSRPLLKIAAIVALEHHEKWDGTGYPRGLKTTDINIYGRITAIADVFDALGSDRVYKKAWEDEKIFQLLRQESGKHFDPRLIDIFFDNLDEFLEVRNDLKD